MEADWCFRPWQRHRRLAAKRRIADYAAYQAVD
jgi:hypothetical protein